MSRISRRRSHDKRMKRERAEAVGLARKVMHALNAAKLPGLVFGVVERYGEVSVLAIGGKKVLCMHVQWEEGDTVMELPGLHQVTRQ